MKSTNVTDINKWKENERQSRLYSAIATVAIIVFIIFIVAVSNASASSKSDADSVVLYSSNYADIETYHDSDYIIRVYDEKSVIVTNRITNESKSYGWSHVVRISLK